MVKYKKQQLRETLENVITKILNESKEYKKKEYKTISDSNDHIKEIVTEAINELQEQHGFDLKKSIKSLKNKKKVKSL